MVFDVTEDSIPCSVVDRCNCTPQTAQTPDAAIAALRHIISYRPRQAKNLCRDTCRLHHSHPALNNHSASRGWQSMCGRRTDVSYWKLAGVANKDTKAKPMQRNETAVHRKRKNLCNEQRHLLFFTPRRRSYAYRQSD